MDSNTNTNVEDDSVIINNKDIVMIKTSKNTYSINYSITNNKMYLWKILDFTIVKILYDLNKDFFETVNLNIIDDNNAKLFILMKPLMADFGVPQRYCYLDLQRERYVPDNIITIFTATPNRNIDEARSISKIPKLAEMLPIKSIKITCENLDEHNVSIEQKICYETFFEIPKFMEKFAGTIFTKMFLRTKQFIENIGI
jgi:hypothetical protein